MTIIHEIQQILYFNTPLGIGQALFVMDYGVHENTIFIIAIEESGEIKHFTSNQVTVCRNHTTLMNLKDEKPHGK